MSLSADFPTIDTPLSITLADHLTTEERDQILQTIEMFEAITLANPDDYQSLEILKEAYWKVDRHQDGLAVTRRLADTYMRLGQYSSALLEYEGILQQEPSSQEVAAILAELEGKLHHSKSPIALDFGIDEGLQTLEESQAAEPNESDQPILEPASPPDEPASDPVGEIRRADLIQTKATSVAPEIVRQQIALAPETDGNEPLAKFLIQHRLAAQEAVAAALSRVRQRNDAGRAARNGGGQVLGASLLEELGAGGVSLEPIMAGIVDRTKFAFVPLDYYDVDRQIIKMVPEQLTLGRLIVPFDIVSRTMMVAMENPFDAAAKAAVQQAVDYHIQWYVAMPAVIQKILREAFRIND